MKRLMLRKLAFTFISLFCLTTVVFAQEEGKIVPIPTAPDPGRRPSKPRTTVTTSAVAKATVTTGSLMVIAEPLADVSLDLVGGQRSDNREGKIPVGQTHFIFNDLRTGSYSVSAELSGYEDTSGKKGEQVVNIQAGKPTVVAFKLRPVTYNVPIKTNVPSGEVRYSKKDISAKEGIYCIAEIRNGQAVLPELRAGQYQLEIRTNEVGYQTLRETIEVGSGNTGFEATLSYNVSKVPFGPNIDPASWELPRGWRTSPGKTLLAKGKGIGLPSLNTARHYANFEMESTVRIVNGDLVSFVFRAQDLKTYYLIEIAKGQEGGIRGYVVKDGKKTLFTNPVPLTDASLLNDFFTVKFCVIGHAITVAVEAFDGRIAGRVVLEDGNQTFSIGAPGIAISDQEEVEVGRFYVYNWDAKTCRPDDK